MPLPMIISASVKLQTTCCAQLNTPVEIIAIATITDNRHNQATRVVRRNTQRAGHRAARTNTTKDTFQLRQLAHLLLGITLFNIQHLIYQVWSKDARSVGRCPAANTGNVTALCWLQADNLHLRILAFQVTATPVTVPVVPMVETKCVIQPAVWCQISGPVVEKWAYGLSGLLN